MWLLLFVLKKSKMTMILDRRLAVLGLKMACEANPSPEDWPTHGAWVCESCSAGGDWLAVWCSAFTWFVISCGQIFTLLSFRFLSNLVGKDLSDQVENAQANFCGRSENNLLDKHVMDSSFVFNPGRRREDSLWWTIRGGFAQKGYLLQALGISKGRDFTSWSI